MPTITPTTLTNDDLFTQLKCVLETKDEMLQYDTGVGDIVINLSRVDWFTPAFLAPFSVVYNELMHGGVNVEISFPPEYGSREYLNQICFPEGTHDPTNNFQNHIPLCLMSSDHGQSIIESVGRKVRELVRENYSSFSSGAIDGVTYPIKETIDNVDCHSQCHFGTLLIQNYPNKPFLDICVADDGISIPGSYDQHETEYDTDTEAIQLALQGVSTRPDTGHMRGYGLRTTVNMICDGLNGEVLISSRNAVINRQGNDVTERTFENLHWDGTIFVARLYEPDDDFNYLEYLT